VVVSSSMAVHSESEFVIRVWDSLVDILVSTRMRLQVSWNAKRDASEA
jgi:hypothetical protein